MITDDLMATETRGVPAGIACIVVSVCVHAVGLGVLSYGVLHAPEIREETTLERYSLRHIEFHSPDSPAIEDGTGSAQTAHESRTGTAATKASSSATDPAPSETAPESAGKQTLLQSQFDSHLTLSPNVPVPTMVFWTPEWATVKNIVPPIPDTPSSAESASLDPPNTEFDLGNIAVSSANLAARLTAPPPATTSPLVVHAPSLLRMAPVTASRSHEQPTPAAVVSLSDLRLQDGTILLPPLNEVRATKKVTELAVAENAPKSEIPDTVIHAGTRPSDSSDQASQSASPQTGDNSSQHIQYPANGRFGVVVVGDSIADQYPQTVQIWSDRVAYAAYIHVGLTKNWILQYSSVPSAAVANNGSVVRIEAPWPYDIWRPNLVSMDLQADALMVHGILNTAGRLESLTIAFPQQFPRAEFVISALKRWQFRPARQAGNALPVEVLLIIPDESE